MASTTREQLIQHIHQYIDGDIDLDELDDWVNLHALHVPAGSDALIERIVQSVHRLHLDLAYGFVTDSDARAELARLVDPLTVAAHSQVVAEAEP